LPVKPLAEASTLAQDQGTLESRTSWQVPYHQLAAAGADLVLEHRERCEEVRCALERLPAFDRHLVYLCYFRCASMQEIAARTGVNKHVVEVRLWRARRTLRKALEESMQDSLGQHKQPALARSPRRSKRENHHKTRWSSLAAQQMPLRAGESTSLLRKEEILSGYDHACRDGRGPSTSVGWRSATLW
jgi:Sigma-70, region 4